MDEITNLKIKLFKLLLDKVGDSKDDIELVKLLLNDPKVRESFKCGVINLDPGGIKK